MTGKWTINIHRLIDIRSICKKNITLFRSKTFFMQNILLFTNTLNSVNPT